MEVTKAYKIRLYPSKLQEQELLKTIGACRFVYNFYLNIQLNAYSQTGKIIPYGSLAADLTKLRKEIDWLADAPSIPVRQSLRQLDYAYSTYFRKKNNLPRFKTKKHGNRSFRKVGGWVFRDGKLQVVKGLTLNYRGSLPDSKLNTGITISVSKTGKWFASVTAKEIIEVAQHIKPIGIDLGLTHIAITSKGDKFDNLKLSLIRAKRLKYLSQSLARKKKGSNRRAKARLEIARLHEKVANQRMNYLHQVSSAITSKNHALIAVEDLAVGNMLKNRHLSRSISDASWSELLRQIQYKQLWRGGQFVKVGRFYPSSKTCSNCGTIQEKMPLNVRFWRCPDCLKDHDRDINAALNILKQAEVQLGVESTDGSRKVRVTGSVKRRQVLPDSDKPPINSI